jgi:outer membrane receptor for monomeric catechols
VAFRERSVSAYFGQLLGESFSVGAHYRVSEAELNGQFPDIPAGTPGLAGLEQDERGVLQTLSLTANFHHSSGVFAQWESAWFHQENSGYTPARPGDDFWQHNITLGYRLPRRVAELRCSLLNVFDQDYRLSPVNLHATLPRARTFTLSLRLNF